MLSPVLLELLRDWYRIARPQGWLFPGQNPVNPMTTRQLTRACHAASQMAELTKRVTPHTLRHYLPFPTISSGLSGWSNLIVNLRQYRVPPLRETRHSVLPTTQSRTRSGAKPLPAPIPLPSFLVAPIA